MGALARGWLAGALEVQSSASPGTVLPPLISEGEVGEMGVAHTRVGAHFGAPRCGFLPCAGIERTPGTMFRKCRSPLRVSPVPWAKVLLFSVTSYSGKGTRASTVTVTVGCMEIKRRPRGTLVDRVQLGYPVERRNKELFATIARNANISAAALFDLLVENMPLDENGCPLWLHK
jgi:hypothetical protein